jgi:hypothetical protein
MVMGSPMFVRSSLLALLVVVPLAGGRAAAQPGAADAEFKRGKALMAEGKIAAACDAFDRSQALEANVSTMLNQANCREKNNQLATAHKLFTQAAIQTDRSSDVATVQLHNVALDRAAKLGARVSVVTLDIPAAARVPGLTIKQGSAVLDPMAWGSALELDGGSYTFEVTATDRIAATVAVTVASEKDRKTVTIPTLMVIDKPAPTPVDTTTPPTPVDTTTTPPTPVDTTTPPPPHAGEPTRTTLPVEPEPAAPPPSRTPAYIVGGAGIALAATGLVFHLWAGSTYDDAVAEGNDDNQTTLWHSANTKHYVAVGTGIAGVAAIGVGVWLLLRAPSSERVSVQPAVGTQSASVVVSGWF